MTAIKCAGAQAETAAHILLRSGPGLSRKNEISNVKLASSMVCGINTHSIKLIVVFIIM